MLFEHIIWLVVIKIRLYALLNIEEILQRPVYVLWRVSFARATLDFAWPRYAPPHEV